jgi:hypothetical protein
MWIILALTNVDILKKETISFVQRQSTFNGSQLLVISHILPLRSIPMDSQNALLTDVSSPYHFLNTIKIIYFVRNIDYNSFNIAKCRGREHCRLHSGTHYCCLYDRRNFLVAVQTEWLYPHHRDTQTVKTFVVRKFLSVLYFKLCNACIIRRLPQCWLKEWFS